MAQRDADKGRTAGGVPSNGSEVAQPRRAQTQAPSQPSGQSKPATGGGAEKAQPTFQAPCVSLPKGGGALRSVGEKFETNAFNGTATTSVPIPVPAGRDGLGPELTLSYDSGRGNGPFGLGWSIGVASITRQTARGVPRYVDALDSDVYILSGAEDLVPVLIDGDLIDDVPPDAELSNNFQSAPAHPAVAKRTKPRVPRTNLDDFAADHSGGALRRIDQRGEVEVSFYRPRTEGLYARIERHENKTTSVVHWEVWSKDGRRSTFGRSDDSRIANPEHPLEVFEWLLDETFDTKGNVVEYGYYKEDLANVALTLPAERARLTGSGKQAQRYLKHIRYANRLPDDRSNYCFEVLFDYGNHASEVIGIGPVDAIEHRESRRVRIEHMPTATWRARRDAFSVCRPGFDLRTRRLCQRVLVFHKFDELLNGAPTLVSSTELRYDENASATRLVGVIQRSYLQAADGFGEVADLPELRFSYVSDELRSEQSVVPSQAATAAGMSGEAQRFVDLFGEGIAGVLRENEGTLYYAPPRGELTFGPFAPVHTQANAPIRAGGARLADANGDGLLDVVAYASTEFLPGFFPQQDVGGFGAFQPFSAMPNVEWSARNVQLFDLSGDGRADVVVMRGEEILWYPSVGAKGFGAPRIARLRPGDHGPVHLYQDATALYQVADMTGDGLGDLVRVRASDVTFWPSLGHGRFGAPVVLTLPPGLGSGSFDPARLRLGDLDGTGTTDILYLEVECVRVFRNAAGNELIEDVPIIAPAQLTAAQVELADVFGDGTTALLFSIPRGSGPSNVIAIHPFKGEKPNILTELDNGSGRRVKFEYRSSTSYYLDDQRKGRPWLTKLPFPINLLARVETFDKIAKTRSVVRYAYHHGYYDGVEREFRGFAFVEQWDTESFSEFGEDGLFAAVIDEELVEALHNPPVHTRTWFHTGRDGSDDRVEHGLKASYFGATFDAAGRLQPHPLDLSEHDFPADLWTEEHREAARVLRGKPLRVEVYGLQSGEQVGTTPHQVTESAYTVRLVQRAEGVRHSVLDVVERETLSVHYEREANDPRVEHRAVVAHDRYGQPLATFEIAYGRNSPVSLPLERQAITLMTLAKVWIANDDKEEDRYRLAVPVAESTYELQPPSRPPGQVFRWPELATIARDEGFSSDVLTHAPSDENAPTPPARRLVRAVRTRYYDDAVSGPLPLGEVGLHALAYRSATAVLSVTQLPKLLPSEIDEATLDALGYEQGRLHEHEFWWAKGERMVHGAASTFFAPVGAVDPRGRSYTLSYDPYSLFLQETLDPHGNCTLATLDYRVLQPKRVVDPNGGASEVDFDVRGLPFQIRLMGRGEGDTDATSITDYDLFAFRDSGPVMAPNWARERQRETHRDPDSRWTEQRTYFDGSGRAALVKQRAEPGAALAPDGSGQTVHADPRWLGTGRTVFDNKGNPVKQYEPYFSTHDAYETEPAFRKQGVTPILTYDALGRLIRTDLPDGSFSRVVLSAWSTVEYDPIDTCLEEGGVWAQREPKRAALVVENELSQKELDAEKRAAKKAEALADTPSISHVDPRGRAIVVVAELLQAGAAARPLTTETYFDAAGESEEVKDPRGVLAEHIVRRLDGSPLARHSADAGSRVMFTDALGMPTHVWTGELGAVSPSADRITNQYDALSRPIETWAREAGSERLAEAFVYGDTKPQEQQLQTPEVHYLRGKPVRVFDGAGIILISKYDFKGNPLEQERRVLALGDVRVNWRSTHHVQTLGATPTVLHPSIIAMLSGDGFLETSSFDALNRPTSTRYHDATRTRGTVKRRWNERGLSADIQLKQANGVFRPVLAAATYDEKGRRLEVRLGNGVITQYTYERETFRLTRLVSKKANGFLLQSLHYFYDWVGNITEIWDRSDFITKNVSNPKSADQDFDYDSLYRLIAATGREHQSVGQPDHTDLTPITNVHPHDPGRMQHYKETYSYDDGGNFEEHRHKAGPGWVQGWTRTYDVDPTSNRLRNTTGKSGGGAVQYAYDDRGNMTSISGHMRMDWDYADRLVTGTKESDTQRIWFSYDSEGTRVRKAVLDAGGLRRERIYAGDLEAYREVGGAEWESIRIHDGEAFYALIETRIGGGTVERYQGANHLGTVTFELDGSGSELSYEESHPYGTCAYRARSGVLSPARYRYTGKERDEETGLQYHQARYYACWLGRWVSADPSLLADGPNQHAYARQTPMGSLDPSGRATETQQVKTLVAEWKKEPLLVYADLDTEIAQIGGLGKQQRDDLAAKLDYAQHELPGKFAGEAKLDESSPERPSQEFDRNNPGQTSYESRSNKKSWRAYVGKMIEREVERFYLKVPSSVREFLSRLKMRFAASAVHAAMSESSGSRQGLRMAAWFGTAMDHLGHAATASIAGANQLFSGNQSNSRSRGFAHLGVATATAALSMFGPSAVSSVLPSSLTDAFELSMEVVLTALPIVAAVGGGSLALGLSTLAASVAAAVATAGAAIVAALPTIAIVLAAVAIVAVGTYAYMRLRDSD